MPRTMFARFAFAASAVLGASPALAQSAPPVCPFTPAELQAALGQTFDAGTAGQELKASSLTMRSCQYNANRWSLRVSSTIYQNAADAKKFDMVLAGKKVPIPNDPDGAIYQEGQGDNTSPTVHYVRGNVHVELRVTGIYYRDSASRQKDMEALRERLAKLKRVP